MKAPTTLILLATTSCVIFAKEVKPELKPIVVVERPTHRQIAKKQGVQREEKAKVRVNKELKPIITVKKKLSLVERSTLLASGAYCAMVPKGSVIYVPDRYKNKVVMKPQGKLKNWNAFLSANSGWIHLHQVRLKQAFGQEFLNEDKMKAYKSIGKIVIAVNGGNPISVAPKALVIPLENEEIKSK